MHGNTLVERIDQVTGSAPRLGRSAEDIVAYGAALDDMRAQLGVSYPTHR